MGFRPRSLLLLIALLASLAVLAACGSGDDVDDSADDDDDSSESSNNNGSSSSRDTDIPTIKEGVLGEGTVHIEVSGDKDFEVDTKGSGIVSGPLALLTFVSPDATVLITFQSGSEGEPGAVSITTADLSTAGEWGKDCSVEVDDGATELKGSFTCNKVEAVELKSLESHQVRLEGNFSVPR